MRGGKFEIKIKIRVGMTYAMTWHVDVWNIACGISGDPNTKIKQGRLFGTQDYKLKLFTT